jgi:D-3-phosphoglycerate dehydrogenase / 2-oxoglutarate reductase
MKVLICDPVADNAIQLMKDGGLDVHVKTGMSLEQLIEVVPEYDVAVVRSATKFRANTLEKSTNLKLVVRGGVGLDNIDLVKAKELGIEVRNTPSASSASVAELALAHMFALSRFIPAANVTMKQGEWNKKQYKGSEIGGKTLGIVGVGRIGQELAKRAQALGMKVSGYDKFVKDSPLPETINMVSFEDLLKNSDFISLHIPFIPAEGPSFTEKELKSMKKGAFLINCARGGTVDEAALVKVLDEGHLAGAGVDVFEKEPCGLNDLVKHTKVSITPHIGASTKEAQDRVGTEVASIIVDFYNNNK